MVRGTKEQQTQKRMLTSGTRMIAARSFSCLNSWKASVVTVKNAGTTTAPPPSAPPGAASISDSRSRLSALPPTMRTSSASVRSPRARTSSGGAAGVALETMASISLSFFFANICL
jgi:hypothetical protein